MQVNFLLFPALTQLDLAGPFEVLARAPSFKIDFVSPTMDTVYSDRGLALAPTATFATAKRCDILVVPGGPGTDAALVDPGWVEFTARQGMDAKFILGVCTGSLLLGAAGLLRGKRAACHWHAREFLASFGAIPDESRTCIDGNIITSGGVTSGIDMALRAVSIILNEDAARQIQLQIEYDPEPPFEGGTPRSSPQHIVDLCVNAARERHAQRAQAVAKAAAALVAKAG